MDGELFTGNKCNNAEVEEEGALTLRPHFDRAFAVTVSTLLEVC